MSDRERALQLLDTVPEYKIKYVIAYLQELITDELDPSVDNNQSVKPKMTVGVLSSKFHFVSDDFDETPECFAEYIW